MVEFTSCDRDHISPQNLKCLVSGPLQKQTNVLAPEYYRMQERIGEIFIQNFMKESSKIGLRSIKFERNPSHLAKNQVLECERVLSWNIQEVY